VFHFRLRVFVLEGKKDVNPGWVLSCEVTGGCLKPLCAGFPKQAG